MNNNPLRAQNHSAAWYSPCKNTSVVPVIVGRAVGEGVGGGKPDASQKKSGRTLAERYRKQNW